MKSFLDVIEDKVLIGDDCWEWTGYKNPHGYGIVNRGGKMRKAHQEMYEMTKGPIPAGLEIDHLCRNTSCIRPSHLEAVTHAVNVHRGNAWAGRNIRKTHCKHGHEFTVENTIIRRDGRECRACKRAWNLANNWRFR